MIRLSGKSRSATLEEVWSAPLDWCLSAGYGGAIPEDLARRLGIVMAVFRSLSAVEALLL